MAFTRTTSLLLLLLTIFLLSRLADTQDGETCAMDGRCEGQPCVDSLKLCSVWADAGKCLDEKTAAFMLRRCANSCNSCGPCLDENAGCDGWAKSGECEQNPQYMLRSCRKACSACDSVALDSDFGEEQKITEKYADEIQKALEDMKGYFHTLRNDPNTSIQTHVLLDECKNRNEECTFWKVLGECDVNPSYMKLNCAAVCQTCDYLDENARCPIDPNAFNAWGPGDLDRFFVNISTLPEFQIYKPSVLSRPSYAGKDTPEASEYKIGPWVVTLDDFVTDAEAQRLIDLGAKLGYERSSGVGAKKFDGSIESVISETRTSTNAWCDESCYNDTLVAQVINRIEHITNIPSNFSEPFQLLKYEIGQFYGTHHDYLIHHADGQAGPRILTVFLYLNDVKGGGGTNFPMLNITVMPKRGRALIWPSVLDDDPFQEDSRTRHQALPVEEGIKYGANAWIHIRETRKVLDANCM